MDSSSVMDITPRSQLEDADPTPRASNEATPDNATLQITEPAPQSTPLSRTDTLVSEPEVGTKASSSKAVEDEGTGKQSTDADVQKNETENNEKSEKRATQIVDVDKFINSDYVPKSLRPQYSNLRKISLLVLFCVAQFLDIFNNSSLFSAIPFIANALHMTSDESTWIVSALQLSFAAFLLVSGRISDVYSSKSSFIVGLFFIGVINLGIGWVENKICLFVIRGVNGFFSALTIPSALNLIVRLFPDPNEQSKALSAFGATGAIANICGYVIGAIFVQLVTWRWVFWFAACIAFPLTGIALWLIPPDEELRRYSRSFHQDHKTLTGIDFVGVAIFTSALILLIFGITSGSGSGWGSARALAPLIISIFLLAGFLYYETLIPEDEAIVPPSTWFYPNFSVLFGAALLPYLWWVSLFLIYTQYWDEVFNWGPLTTALHMLPLGLAGLAVTWTGSLSHKVNSKWLILLGEVMALAASLCFPFSGPRDRYWPLVFPAFLIGSAGMMLILLHCNIAIFATTPPRMAGTVGAIFNSSLQLGSAVGIAVVTSIQTSIQQKSADGEFKFTGRADALWFIVAVVALEVVALLFFFDTTSRRNWTVDQEKVVEVETTRKVESRSQTIVGPSKEAEDRV